MKKLIIGCLLTVAAVLLFFPRVVFYAYYTPDALAGMSFYGLTGKLPPPPRKPPALLRKLSPGTAKYYDVLIDGM